MKKAIMVATLCTMFFSILAQDINYREWVFTNADIDVVAIYKATCDVDSVQDWGAYYENPTSGQIKLLEKPYNGETFFDIKEMGVYMIIGYNSSTGEVTKETDIVVNQEFLDTMKELGWAKEINGKLSSKPYPLRFGRDEDVFVSAKSMIKFCDQKEL